MKRRSCGRDEPRARAGGCDIYWAKPAGAEEGRALRAILPPPSGA